MALLQRHFLARTPARNSLRWGRGLLNGIVAVAVTWWPWYARLARAEALMYVADSLPVMRPGKVIEPGPAGRLIGQQEQAYTRELLGFGRSGA